MRTVMTAMLALLCAAPLLAQDAPTLKKGEQAPELGARFWIQAPEFTTITELRGRVTLVMLLGMD